VATREVESGVLSRAVCFVGVTRRHVERLIDFQAPGAALYRLIGRLFGKISVQRVSRSFGNDVTHVGAYLSMENCIFSL